MNFAELGLTDKTLKALEKRGFEEPTEIQARCIPLLLSGTRDVLGQAQTGTGKTAAFGLPILERVNTRSKHVQALILTPTRELAIQVAEEINSFTGSRSIQIAAIYGGQSIGMQIGQLRRGCHIVVGTPGRVIDHIQRKTLQLDQVSMLVLDEADEMLNMGFIEEVETILQAIPAERNTLLFSATMPKPILRLAEQYMGDYEQIVVKHNDLTSDLTEQIYLEVRHYEKIEALRRVIDLEEDFYGLVFCRTKSDCDDVAKQLSNSGYAAEAFHGDMSQSQREKFLTRFREKQITTLVATDVAARGIDVQNLTHVINYSLPQNAESYVHRIGRTGRAGNMGTAITFITPEEYRKLQHIKRTTGTDIQKKKLPTVQELLKVKRDRIMQEIDQAVVGSEIDEFSTMALRLIDQYGAEELVASLLRSNYKQDLDAGNYKEIGQYDQQRGPNIQKSTRLFIAKGKKHDMTKRSLVEYISKVSSVPGRFIDDVQVMADFSFVSVSLRDAEKILESFKRSKPGKRAIVTKAKDSENISERKRPYRKQPGKYRDGRRGYNKYHR